MLDTISRAYLAHLGGRVEAIRPLTVTPRVSVVIPCYNYGRFLRRCVKSLTTNQPDIEIEIIIVDDKSTDDSLETALAIQMEDERVRVVAHPVNKGHIATYNDGLWKVSGEFVLLMSADDMATPGALTRAAALLAAEETVGMVYGNAVTFDGEPPPSRTEGKAWIVWSGQDWLLGRCRSGYNVIASPEVMMRTSVLHAIGGYRPDLPHAGDFEMWLRASAVADVGFLVGVDQAYYRHHASNMNSKTFHSGSARGQFVDLKQRWQSFEAVFEGVGKQLAQADFLIDVARNTIANEALGMVNYAYARGFKDFPIDDFVDLAYQVYPKISEMNAGRAYVRRRKLGMLSLPLHPLWALSAIVQRLRSPVRRFRLHRIGV